MIAEIARVLRPAGSMVTHVLRRDPDSLPKLVRAELAVTSDESLGAQLVISAHKPRPRGR